MGDFLSILYTVVDTLSLIFFLDAFATRRWDNWKFKLGVGCFIALLCWVLQVPFVFFGRDPAIKIGMIILAYTISARVLYKEISNSMLLLLVCIEYLVTYYLSFGLGMMGAFICGMDGEAFRSNFPLAMVYGGINYSAELFLTFTFRKVMRQRRLSKKSNNLTSVQSLLYFLFPSTSFVMLVLLLYMTTGKDASEAVVAAACGSIFAANVAILYLLERMEKTAENQERVLALEQQLQFQAKNMEAASQLYTAQRHKVHDFRAHLNILQGLLQNQEYDAAEQYLNSVTKEQTDRLFLVNSHHSILDALFNTKATEAIRKGIDIDFELNDLSMLPFDVSDMVVLFSNLLDNSIEACEKVDGNRVIRVSVVLKRSLLFSIRNTTLPVKIKNDTIQTTKPNASLHGFGLSNIKLIINKYHADFVMDYTYRWFQFTGEIETYPIL